MALKSNFIVRGGLDMSGFKKGLDQTQKQLTTFQSTISKSMNMVKLAIGSVAIGALVKDSVKAAMTVESSMNQLSRTMGDSANEFNSWAKGQAKAFGMAREEAYKYGAIYSNLISGFTKDIKETNKYTTQLVQASAVIASATGRTVDDVSERIRSGLLGNTEAIEDVGIYAQVAMLKSTKAFKEMANGRSWDKLSYYEQQQIRILSVLEQAYTKYGNTLAGTTATAQMKFLATLKNIRLNIGQAFMPIYNIVLPALNSLASKIESITAILAEVSLALFGKAVVSTANTKKQTEAVTDLGKATEEAANAAKKATAGFDELNILSFNKNEDGTDGEGTNRDGLDISSGVVENTNSFKHSIEKLGDALKPASIALKNFYNDALKPFMGFVFDNLKSFYNNFLVPVGKWILGEGLSRLLNVVTGLFSNIDWDKLNKAFTELYKALAPFAISVGEGLISFIEGLGEILTPIVTAAADLLAKALKNIANAINLIPEDVAIAIGGAIGGIATALLLFVGAKAVAGIILNIAGGLGTLLRTLVAHPVLALAAGIAALAGAVIALNKAKFNNSEIGQYIKKVDALCESSKELNKEIQEMLDKHEERRQDIVEEYGAVEILADRYFDLAGKAKLTNDEQILLKTYAQELINKIPELSSLIDEQTGAYKGTKEEIEALIERSKEYYLVKAAEESLIEIAKAQYESEKKLKDLADERKVAEDKLSAAEQERGDYYKKRLEETNNKAKALFDTSQKFDEKLNALEKTINKVDVQIAETTQTQQDLNSEWNYATGYITTYSKTTKTEMTKIYDSVSGTFTELKNEVKNFVLPELKTKVTVDKSALTDFYNSLDNNNYSVNFRPTLPVKQYATGGMPDTGEMFVARESGPELVGRIGNQSAVVNNDQIVEAVSIGVASAIAPLMGGGQVIENILYLDNEVVYRANNKAKRKNDIRYSPVIVGG